MIFIKLEYLKYLYINKLSFVENNLMASKIILTSFLLVTKLAVAAFTEKEIELRIKLSTH
tara:strand:- start:958 stop:1137 length:180 start_codon:yes stop_codon:yes gene_type:complete